MYAEIKEAKEVQDDR